MVEVVVERNNFVYQIIRTELMPLCIGKVQAGHCNAKRYRAQSK